jgi:hypothetical protein
VGWRKKKEREKKKEWLFLLTSSLYYRWVPDGID